MLAAVASRVRQFRLACAYEEGDGVASSRECGGGSCCTKDLLLNQVKKQRPSGTLHSDLLVDFRPFYLLIPVDSSSVRRQATVNAAPFAAMMHDAGE